MNQMVGKIFAALIVFYYRYHFAFYIFAQI